PSRTWCATRLGTLRLRYASGIAAPRRLGRATHATGDTERSPSSENDFAHVGLILQHSLPCLGTLDSSKKVNHEMPRERFTRVAITRALCLSAKLDLSVPQKYLPNGRQIRHR